MKSLNALSMLVAREKPGFQALSKGLIVLHRAQSINDDDDNYAKKLNTVSQYLRNTVHATY